MVNETEKETGEKVGGYLNGHALSGNTVTRLEVSEYDVKRETLMRGTARRVDANLASSTGGLQFTHVPFFDSCVSIILVQYLCAIQYSACVLRRDFLRRFQPDLHCSRF